MVKKKVPYSKFLAGTKKILDASSEETKPYETEVLGKKFMVFPNVFSPKYFRDTELFAANLPVVNGEEILEIGPGTGAISLIAAIKGAAKVVAVDINPTAVQNTRTNIELYGMGGTVEVRLGNVYSAITKEEKFDTIFWNTPFGYVTDSNLTDLEKSVYDQNYRSTEIFIKQAKRHLKPSGRVLIGFSTTLGKFELIEKFVKNSGMMIRKLFETDSMETYPVKFEIFEATVDSRKPR